MNIEVSDSEMEESDGDLDILAHRSLGKEDELQKATNLNLVAEMLEEQQVTVLSDDESDSSYSESVISLEEEKIYSGHNVGIKPISAHGEDKEDIVLKQYSDENEDDEQSDSEEEPSGEEEYDEQVGLEVLNPCELSSPLFLEEEDAGTKGVYENQPEDTGSIKEPLWKLMSTAPEELYEKSMEAHLDEADEALLGEIGKSPTMVEETKDTITLKLTDPVEASSASSPIVNDTTANEDEMSSRKVTDQVSPLVLVKETVKLIKTGDESTVTLAGTKRSSDEVEEDNVRTDVSRVTAVTIQAGVIPRAYKKMKRSGTAFGVGMAAGLVAGMVGTFAGLSSFALSDSSLS